MSASSSTARSSASRTMTGTSAIPSNCAARQRRSPAINSSLELRSRTISGWTMPCSLIESASSRKASSANILRGWNGRAGRGSTAHAGRALASRTRKLRRELLFEPGRRLRRFRDGITAQQCPSPCPEQV